MNWELQPGRTIHTLKGIAPAIDSDFSSMNIVSWSPDRELLAVPGLKNDVVMYDKDMQKNCFHLEVIMCSPFAFSWSPNGKYMATSGLDRQVLIWDVEKKQDIDQQKFENRVTCMAWKPIGNALAIIDVMGKYGVWESAVPSSVRSPTEDIPALSSKNGPGLLFFDKEAGKPSTSGSLRDLGEDSHGEFEPFSRKRLRKQHSYDDWEKIVMRNQSYLQKLNLERWLLVLTGMVQKINEMSSRMCQFVQGQRCKKLFRQVKLHSYLAKDTFYVTVCLVV